MERGLINTKKGGNQGLKNVLEKKFIILAIQKFQVDQMQESNAVLGCGKQF